MQGSDSSETRQSPRSPESPLVPAERTNRMERPVASPQPMRTDRLTYINALQRTGHESMHPDLSLRRRRHASHIREAGRGGSLLFSADRGTGLHCIVVSMFGSFVPCNSPRSIICCPRPPLRESDRCRRCLALRSIRLDRAPLLPDASEAPSRPPAPTWSPSVPGAWFGSTHAPGKHPPR